MTWVVNWDNGNDACGTFPWEFDTEEAAQSFADDWVITSCSEWGIDPDSEDAPSAEPYYLQDREIDMSQCPSMDRNNPMYECPEDNVCAWCGQELPENPVPLMWAFHGVCDARCALYQGLSDLGVAPGMETPKGITPEYRDQILKAVAQVTAGYPQRSKQT